MTAPVSMARSAGQWRVHFVMPSKHTLDTLPKPNNPAVTLREVPETDYPVIGALQDLRSARRYRQ